MFIQILDLIPDTLFLFEKRLKKAQEKCIINVLCVFVCNYICMYSWIILKKKKKYTTSDPVPQAYCNQFIMTY